jgi:hypothetical protein
LDEQIVRIFLEADEDSVTEAAKRQWVSDPAIFGWRKKIAN